MNQQQPYQQQQQPPYQAPQQQYQQQYQQAPQQPPYQQAPQQVNVTIEQPKGKSVSKIAYVLLALFLGGLGIHNFYAGKTLLGIIYLVFCWTFIPAIAALVQAIIALCKPSDQNGNIYI